MEESDDNETEIDLDLGPGDEETEVDLDDEPGEKKDDNNESDFDDDEFDATPLGAALRDGK